MILAIDPGRDTGWAIVDVDANLKDAGLGEPPVSYVGPVIIERPQVYRGRSSRSDPNDLITLAIQVGRYTERFETRGCKVEHVIPHTWKGSVDPDVLCRRILSSLSTVESELLHVRLMRVAKGKQHNVIDAVGIAKWSTRRTRAAVFTGG